MPDSPRAPLAEPTAAPGVDRQRVRELDLIIRTFGEVSVVVDDRYRVIACDGAVEHVWGVSADDILGKTLPTMSRRIVLLDAGGSEVPPDRSPTALAFAGGRTQTHPIVGVRQPSGAVRWAHVVAVPVPATGDRRAHVTTAWTDITRVVEHDPAEDRVRERTAALESTVAELEAFSYTVSHDLRAPARTIRTMVDAVLSDAGAALGPDGRSLLDRIGKTATRIDALTGVLLELAATTRAEPRRTRLDLTLLACEELDHLRGAEPHRAVRATVADGLVAEGDEHLVRTVLHNLLANAWKFTSREPEASIEVGGRTTGNEAVFFVRDNGVGFDVAQRERLFRPFERLHVDQAFEGTGIGLATVKRAVGRHGGRIWADGVPGIGATFSFTLAPPAPCPLLVDPRLRR